MKKLDLQSDCAKFLQSLPPKQFRQIVTKILQLLVNATPQDAQSLKGYPYYRVDVGEYRIVYRFNQDLVTVILLGKRNDDEIYKRLKRK